MTINRIVDTPIMINSYNGRALITNGSITKNCVRQFDGTLWALVCEQYNELHLCRSTDNGFSWSIIREGIQTQLNMRNSNDLNSDGQFAYLVIEERYRLLDVYMGWEDIGGDLYIDRSRFDLDAITDAPSSELVESDVAYGAFDISHNHEQIFITSAQLTDGDIQVTRCSPRSTAISNPVVFNPGGSAWSFLSTVVDKDGHLDIVYGVQETNNFLRHVRFDSDDLSFTAEHELKAFGNTTHKATDIAIARDGFDTLCCVWTDQHNAGTTAVFHYGTSIDDGVNWDDNTPARTAGHTVFKDDITNDYMNRGNVIGGSRGGFLISYVDDDADGIPKTYVRQLTTSDDGATYDLGDEKQVATDEAGGLSVVGLRWFLPTDVKLLDISDPGLVRIAYQVGEGNSDTMDDSVPVNVGQELLYPSAFPSALTSEQSSHTLDTADSVSLRVLVDIHAGPNSNIDFYTAGFIGQFTERYEAAFERIGTSARFLQFEPKTDNHLSDRSAYDAPTESEELILFDPVTYSFPSPALDRDTTLERVEIDVRKIHIPARFYLERTFLVNKGGYLKRTVWLIEHFGNQYELSQIIPRFINNQICYYEANAYVVGPSRDPFSRVLLPSET